MAGRVISVNVGAPSLVLGEESGIDKVPATRIQLADPGPRELGGASGVENDFIGDTEHHGGTDQAVYAVAREELDHWERELGRPLRNGAFGENLTTDALAVDDARIDDIWTIGSVQLRVAAPRVPCATFAAHMGVTGWVKKYAQRCRPGAYLAVITPGAVSSGDEVTATAQAEHSVTVSQALAAWYGDPTALAAVTESGCGSEAFQATYRAIRPRGL